MDINLSVFNGLGTCEEQYEIMKNSCNELITNANIKVIIISVVFWLVWMGLVYYYEKKIKNIKENKEKEN